MKVTVWFTLKKEMLGLLCLLCCLPSANATVITRQLTASDLLHQCQAMIQSKNAPISQNELFSAARCLGYLNGLSAGLVLDHAQTLATLKKLNNSQIANKIERKRYCIDKFVTNEQLARIIVQYIADHPESMQLSDVVIVHRIFDNPKYVMVLQAKTCQQ